MRFGSYRLLVALLAAMLLAACTIAGPTPAPARASSTEQAIFGGGSELLDDPASALDSLRLLGAQTVRVLVQWSAIAPNARSRRAPRPFSASNPASYRTSAWAPYDTFVRDARARGIKVLFDVTGPAPLWAAGTAPPGTSAHNPATWQPSAVQFGQFVKAVATRYGGSYDPQTHMVEPSAADLPRVSEWSVWNEPNYGPDLTPQAVRGVEVGARTYRALLDQAWNALQHTGHSRDTILFGDLAPRGSRFPGTANGTDPLRFLRALYCVSADDTVLRGSAAVARGCPTSAAGSDAFAVHHPALFAASGFAIHPYTRAETGPPNVPSPPEDPDWVGFADLPKLGDTLDALTAAYGSRRRLPIDITELGFQTSPPKQNCRCSSPSVAAAYMNWAEYLSYANPRIASYAQYQLADVSASLEDAGVYTFWASGLVSPSGAQLPTFNAYRLPIYLPVTRVTRGQPQLVWGAVRPAAYARADVRAASLTAPVAAAAQRVQIEFRRAETPDWTTLAVVTVTNPRGYFEARVRFPSSGAVRLRYTYPTQFAFTPTGGAAGTIVSRTVNVAIIRGTK